MIKRDLWERIGGFDELFAPAYCEDSDLAFTVRKMGYRVMYQPQSVVVHFEGVSNGTDTSSGLKKYQIENMAKFREKWAEELSRHPENGDDVFHARDYSYGKKTLLMIDHYVPQFDKDAGSRTVFQYLKMFLDQGFNVKFIGDNFYQHEPYTTVLQQMGIEVLYGPDYAAHWKDWIRENRDSIDYVFLNRPHIAPKYLEFIRQNTKAKIMYYGHDLAFLREMREFEITGDASFRDSSLEWQPKELALMRSADMAYYPSYVEVDEIHSIDPEIRVKAIPAYLFEDVKWDGYDFESRKDIMFIGGFGHRPNVDAVKWLANEILPELLKYLPDIKIHILGSNAPKDVLELASEHLIMEGFVTDEALENFYRGSRIALVPLRYGAGIKGKVVEAMRYGTPVVTTSTGAEGISNAQKALVVEDDAPVLAKHIAELYTDADKLTAMSKNSIAYIQDNYSYSNAISIIGSEFDLC
jgi:glycosyltransferase involved in cell wall biosynthesis